jgi:outer membrane protein assembly factor BamE (lipoprotein component of BamABCDE complex)
MHTTMRSRRKVISAVTLGVFLSLAACSPQFRNHGYAPLQEDLDQIKIGSDTRESVSERIGVPASSGVLNDSGYYYVRTRTRSIGPLAKQPIEREVVAISFSSAGIVQNVERFGMERGKVVPLSRRVTSSSVSDKSFIRQLLGNLGRFRPAGLGG